MVTVTFKLYNMAKIDVEVYLSQLKSFFENNPNDLIDLIGESEKDLFYEKIKTFCFEKDTKNEDFVLTKEDIINIVLSLKFNNTRRLTTKVNKLFDETKYGLIGLN